VGFAVTPALARAADVAQAAPGKSVNERDLDAWLAIAPDGDVTVYTGKVDLGTGPRTALSQMVAWCAHDCGQVINPNGVMNQVEGAIVQTISRTLLEEVWFDRAKVTSVDWGSYPILTFPDVPEIEVELIDHPNDTPWGAGEMAATVVPGAISNAVYDAMGVRLRSVPFTPENVLAALKAQPAGNRGSADDVTPGVRGADLGLPQAK
jgi:CO/xanthine dehydrogenase Mo-binding subunit